MKMLFLDDESWRHDLLERHVKGTHDVWHVHTAEEAIDAIRAHKDAGQPFVVVSLDHDLATGKTEGRAVSTFLKQVSAVWPTDQLPDLVIVHSWNSYAAQLMVADLLDGQLKDVVMAPFRSFNYKDMGFGDWAKIKE